MSASFLGNNGMKLRKLPKTLSVAKVAPVRTLRTEPRGIGARAGLYNTTRWRKLRERVLRRDYYTCQICGAVGAAAGKLVCDHARGHPPNEDEAMFWRGPFQTVCENCHNTVRKTEDTERYNAAIAMG